MRKILLALLALTMLTASVQAQPPSFSETFQVRGAAGDIPSTEAVEPSGSWNLEQRLVVQFDNASSQDARTYRFALPTGTQLVNATCDCTTSRYTQSVNAVTFTIEPATASGLRTIRVTTEQKFDSTVGFSIIRPFEFDGDDMAVILYVPSGSTADGPVTLRSPGASTDGQSVIWFAQFDSSHRAPVDLWFSIHPDNAVTPDNGTGFSLTDGFVWLFLALGLIAGALLWSRLVASGLVQRRGRKQNVTTAAHTDAAANDTPAVLEGKKRALMAALKDIELARQANEIPVEVYDVVKADLKKQAVTVMRALEPAPAAEPKA